MSLTNYTLTVAADATNRYTAGADIDVRVGNPSISFPIFWTLTTDNTAPTPAPTLWNVIKPYEGQAMSLLSGERLWLAGQQGGQVASLEV